MDFRKSSYTISVKLETEEDKYMLVHGYTGAIDIVSGEVINYLNNVDSLQDKNELLSESTFETLKARGYLTIKTEEEEILFVRKMAELTHRAFKLMLYNFKFLVSYDCNFRCPYCYEAKISNYGSKWSKQKFSIDLVDKAYSAMLKIQERRELHSKSILLYGGEPLLKENKEIVNYIVKKGNDLGYNFHAITNGYDLDEYSNLLASGKIGRIQITVDGWKEDHNKKRIHYKHGGTFDKIVENIKLALQNNVYVNIRMNTDVNNFEGMSQLGQYFKQLGFFEFGNFSFHSAMLVDYLQSGSTKQLKYMSRKEFCDKHSRENFQYKFEDCGCSNNLARAIEKKEKLDFKSVYCDAQVGSYVFDPFGKIYSCLETVGKHDSVVGDYNTEDIQWTSLLGKLHSRNVGNLDQCSKCKYAFLCRGGCLTVAAKEGREISSIQCEDYDITFKTIVNATYSKMISEKKL